MHIAFLYSKGRLRRLESVRSGRSASEFFYGSEQLLRAGYSVSLLEPRQEAAQGFRPRLIDRALSMGLLPNKTRGYLLLGVRQLLDELNKHDVVIATTAGLAFSVGIWKALGLVKPEIVGLHCGIVNVEPNWWRRIQIRFLLGRMWSVIYGEAELEPMKRTFGVGEDRIKVNMFGVDTDFWAPADSAVDEGYILSVGNDPRRDYELLRRVAFRLPRRFVVLTWREIRGKLPPNFEKRASSWHQEVLTDEELRDLYRKAALVVIPLKDSFQPSGQSVCLQAMACGKAVVLTSTRGMWSRELMKDGENIALVPPGDEDALKETIEALLHDGDLRRSLGRQARASVVTHFTVESFSHGMLGVCRTAIEDRRKQASMQVPLRRIPALSWWRLAGYFIRLRAALRMAACDPCELSTQTQPAPGASPVFARRRKNTGWISGIEDDDAAALRQIVQGYNIKALLEFGPGVSTHIFLCAGVERIVSCEHDPSWLTMARELFAGDKRVTILPYTNTPVVAVNLEGQTFDAAFVDSPRGNAKARVVLRGQEDLSRYNTLRAALIHAPLAFLHDARRPLEQATLARLVAEGLAEWDMLETTKGIARLRRLKLPE